LGTPRAIFYVRYLFEFGQQLFCWELFTEAADLFRYLTSKLPHEPWTWFWLARCHEELGDPLMAARLYELGSEVGDPQTFQLLAALCFTKAGLPERARSVLVRDGGRL
jgi:tetratricopeptide (TPR) repeat protein